MQTLRKLMRNLGMGQDFNSKTVVFLWEEAVRYPLTKTEWVHYHLFELHVSFEWWAYATERRKIEKLQRFIRYAKRQGRVLRSRKEKRGR